MSRQQLQRYQAERFMQRGCAYQPFNLQVEHLDIWGVLASQLLIAHAPSHLSNLGTASVSAMDSITGLVGHTNRQTTWLQAEKGATCNVSPK